MSQPSKTYVYLAMIAKRINEKKSKFICVIARGEDGAYELYNGEIVDIDELQGAADAIVETLKDFKNNLK